MPAHELVVVYADEALLVLDKPAGLLSVPGRGEDKQDCLSARVQARYADALIVHRLDMATSGLMILARGTAVQRSLNDIFANRQVTKRYIAVVDGHLDQPLDSWGVIDLPILVDWPNRPLRKIDREQGKPSMTRWRWLSYNRENNTTRIELEPITGRSHQLRVHLLAVGHPILGDALYGDIRVQASSSRLLLHAQSLELTHPITSEPLHFFSAAAF